MVDEVFELSWYEIYLLGERQKMILEEKKMLQEFEWQRLSELLCPIYNFMRDAKQKPKPFVPTDFYKPSWHKDEVVISEKRTDEEILSKFPKTLK